MHSAMCSATWYVYLATRCHPRSSTLVLIATSYLCSVVPRSYLQSCTTSAIGLRRVTGLKCGQFPYPSQALSTLAVAEFGDRCRFRRQSPNSATIVASVDRASFGASVPDVPFISSPHALETIVADFGDSRRL